MTVNNPANKPTDSAEFKNYFDSLSKEMNANKLGEIGVKSDKKVQSTVKQVFKAMEALKDKEFDKGKVTFNGKEIDVSSLDFEAIKSFVNFSKKFFKNYMGDPSDIHKTAPTMTSAAEYIASRFTTSNPLKGMKVSSVAHDVIDLKAQMLIKNPVVDKPSKGKQEEKLFLDAKENELNYRAKLIQKGAKNSLTAQGVIKTVATPTKVASVAAGVAGLALLLASNPIGWTIGLIMLVAGPIIFAATGAVEDIVGTSVHDATTMLESLQNQKNNLTPEFYKFLKDYSINPEALVFRTPKGANQDAWLSKNIDLYNYKNSELTRIEFDTLMDYFIDFKELKRKIEEMEEKKRDLEKQIAEEGQMKPATQPPGSATIQPQQTKLERLNEDLKKNTEQLTKAKGEFAKLDEQINQWRVVNPDLLKAKAKL